MDAADLESFPKNRMGPDIVPVFRSDGNETQARFVGTAFCFGLAPWLLTCYHVLGDGEKFFVARPHCATDNPLYLWYPVEGVHPLSPADAALLRVPTMRQRADVLTLAPPDFLTHRGTDVWTFGFPLTDEVWNVGRQQFERVLQGRYLESYITRVFRDQHENNRPTIELAHVLPPGISGAPVVSRPGVDVAAIAQKTYWCQYEGQSYGYGMCVPINTIREAIETVLNEFRSRQV